MIGSGRLAIALAAMAIAQQVSAQDQATALDSLLVQDIRLAAVAERLLGANDEICREQMPLAGWVLHSRDQYPRELGGAAFANGSVAISAVLPRAPAAASGLAPGDGIVAIG